MSASFSDTTSHAPSSFPSRLTTRSPPGTHGSTSLPRSHSPICPGKSKSASLSIRQTVHAAHPFIHAHSHDLAIVLAHLGPWPCCRMWCLHQLNHIGLHFFRLPFPGLSLAKSRFRDTRLEIYTPKFALYGLLFDLGILATVPFDLDLAGIGDESRCDGLDADLKQGFPDPHTGFSFGRIWKSLYIRRIPIPPIPSGCHCPC